MAKADTATIVDPWINPGAIKNASYSSRLHFRPFEFLVEILSPVCFATPGKRNAVFPRGFQNESRFCVRHLWNTGESPYGRRGLIPPWLLPLHPFSPSAFLPFRPFSPFSLYGLSLIYNDFTASFDPIDPGIISLFFRR